MVKSHHNLTVFHLVSAKTPEPGTKQLEAPVSLIDPSHLILPTLSIHTHMHMLFCGIYFHIEPPTL